MVNTELAQQVSSEIELVADAIADYYGYNVPYCESMDVSLLWMVPALVLDDGTVDEDHLEDLQFLASNGRVFPKTLEHASLDEFREYTLAHSEELLSSVHDTFNAYYLGYTGKELSPIRLEDKVQSCLKGRMFTGAGKLEAHLLNHTGQKAYCYDIRNCDDNRCVACIQFVDSYIVTHVYYDASSKLIDCVDVGMPDIDNGLCECPYCGSNEIGIQEDGRFLCRECERAFGLDDILFETLRHMISPKLMETDEDHPLMFEPLQVSLNNADDELATPEVVIIGAFHDPDCRIWFVVPDDGEPVDIDDVNIEDLKKVYYDRICSCS